MYCKNCGNEIVDGSKFCNYCGAPAQPEEAQPTTQAEEATRDDVVNTPTTQPGTDTKADTKGADDGTDVVRRSAFEDMKWDVTDYPDMNNAEKTEDIDFNWDADPADIPDSPRRRTTTTRRQANTEQDTSPVAEADKPQPQASEVLKGDDLEKAVFGETPTDSKPEGMSAADRIDKFYTFNKKNEEFQQLLDREYNKVKAGNAIQHELSKAGELADERFDMRTENSTMEDLFNSEGIVKPYQPKAFESDVLQRIEAQEREREAKRAEEEARLAAIEKAKQEAEAQKKAEEEAAKLADIAKKRAEEEAHAAERARKKAEEEAKRKAEEEARLKAEEEARLKAEAQERVKAEEEARKKAEADLRAAQEAAKIKAQQEAMLAAREEERFKEEQKRREFEAQEAQKKLEEERKRLSEEANQAVAQEEVRRVLEQTAKMQKEEEAKIKAAVEGIKSGHPETVIGASSLTRDEVEEAHRATKNQINEMAKARDAFFAEFDEENKPADENRPVTGRETMLSSNDLGKTRIVDKAAILAGIDADTRVMQKGPIDEALAAENQKQDAVKAAGIAGVAGASEEAHAQSADEPAKAMDVKPEEKAELDDLLSQFESVNEMDNTATPEETTPDAQQGDSALNDTVVMPHNDKLSDLPANDFDSYGDEEAANFINSQQDINEQQNVNDQQNTQTNEGNDEMQQSMDDFFGDDKELSPKEMKRREREERRLAKQQAKAEKKAAKAKGEVNFDDDEDFSDEAADEVAEVKGGKGRIVLKVILIVLIVILVAEVVGIGIKVFAGKSKAAEFIDNQLNKVVQMITGDDETEYSVLAAQARTEPMEDKTDLINSQSDRNIDDNIKSIVYSADLKYDQERDGEVSDLVLSQSLTQVEWGRDDENYPVYYDEQVVGEIIEFESRKVNLRNSGDIAALNMIDPESKLYKKTAKLENKKMSGDFEKLEIGEIRQAGTNYYVWVRETIGDKSTEKVYSMYPKEEFEMKMLASYDI